MNKAICQPLIQKVYYHNTQNQPVTNILQLKALYTFRFVILTYRQFNIYAKFNTYDYQSTRRTESINRLQETSDMIAPLFHFLIPSISIDHQYPQQV